EGDFEGLLEVLDPDVSWQTHTAHGVVIRRGAGEVADRMRQVSRTRGTARTVLVNGQPGIMAWDHRGRPLGVMACTVVEGRIVEMLSVTDPGRLAAMDLPGG